MDGLSIIIPAYNEEGSLEKTTVDCAHAAPGVAREWEIVIIDDGSRDDTPRIAARLARETEGVRVVTHPQNRGFGAAFRSGIDAARLEYVSLIPADGQFPPGDLAKLAAFAEGRDIVVGWRRNRPDPMRRKIVTLLLRCVMFVLFGVTLRDINWVKLYRRDIFRRIRPAYTGIGIDAEITVKAKRAGARFAETRVGYLERKTGQSTGDDPRRIRQTVKEILRLWRSK